MPRGRSQTGAKSGWYLGAEPHDTAPQATEKPLLTCGAETGRHPSSRPAAHSMHQRRNGRPEKRSSIASKLKSPVPRGMRWPKLSCPACPACRHVRLGAFDNLCSSGKTGRDEDRHGAPRHARVDQCFVTDWFSVASVPLASRQCFKRHGQDARGTRKSVSDTTLANRGIREQTGSPGRRRWPQADR